MQAEVGAAGGRAVVAVAMMVVGVAVVLLHVPTMAVLPCLCWLLGGCCRLCGCLLGGGARVPRVQRVVAITPSCSCSCRCLVLLTALHVHAATLSSCRLWEPQVYQGLKVLLHLQLV